MTELKRETKIFPAWDKRNPDPSKNYGISGVSLLMLVVGPKGAYQFKLSMPWYLPGSLPAKSIQSTVDNYDFTYPKIVAELGEGVLPTDVGYHSYVPQYEDQTSMGPCDVLGGKECYYDGSGCYAHEVFGLLVSGGSDAVFAELERLYRERFEV